MVKKHIKPSKEQLKQMYCTFANLYGLITSQDAYQIIRNYFPDCKKDDFYKDIKSRHGKNTQGFRVYKALQQKGEYIIGIEFDDEKKVVELYQAQGQMPFWTPDKLEDYLFFSSSNFYEKTDSGKKC